MVDQQKISLGRVRQAYGLNANEVESVIQALWPRGAVFPLDLWRKADATFWRAFADSNQAVYKIESPALPETDPDYTKYFHTSLFSLDIETFFRKLSMNIHSHALYEGLKYILEESYEEIDTIFPEERDFLFSTLRRLEETDVSTQYEPSNELFEEKIVSIPCSSYHFIVSIFPCTILVDTIAVIRHLRHYPLRQEVKGITRRLVHSILRDLDRETAAASEAPPARTEPEAEAPERKRSLAVPAALWEGKPPAAVRDAMKADFAAPVIAYVLLNWCGVSKTQTGRLLSEKQYEDEKSYRNVAGGLLEKAARLTIIKG